MLEKWKRVILQLLWIRSNFQWLEVQPLLHGCWRSDKSLRARFTLFTPSQKTLSTAQNTTSIFKKHLTIIHMTTKLVEKDPGSQKRLRDDSGGDSNDRTGIPQTKRQCTFVSKSLMLATKLFKFNIRIYCGRHVGVVYCRSTSIQELIGGVHAIQVPGRRHSLYI